MTPLPPRSTSSKALPEALPGGSGVSALKQLTLSNLKPARGATHRAKLLGRGEGSGHGQTSTRGMKGQRSRSGDTRMMGFEGGQMPLLRRVPKRGFNNAVFRTTVAVVNVGSLERCFKPNDTVSSQELCQRRLVSNPDVVIKVLGQGTLTKSLHIKVHKVSAKAKQMIESVGGQVEIIALEKTKG